MYLLRLYYITLKGHYQKKITFGEKHTLKLYYSYLANTGLECNSRVV